MWQTVKKYYLGTFILLFIALCFKTIGTKSTNTPWFNFLIILAFSLGLTLIVGTLYYFQDTKWGPNRKKRLFNKKPFVDLLQNGFIKQDDLFIGNVSNYTVVITYIWPGGKPTIEVGVMFHPKTNGIFNTPEEIKLIAKRNKRGFLSEGYVWSLGSVTDLIGYNFKTPTYDMLLSKAQAMINILIKENLQPISYPDSEKLLLAYEKEIKGIY